MSRKSVFAQQYSAICSGIYIFRHLARQSPVREFAMSLVITRKSGQSLSVGDATITFTIENGRIRLIIDAPREVKVVRSELAQEHPEL